MIKTKGKVNRVFRGESWFNNARGCRSADRYFYMPGDQSYDLGFRLARKVC